MSLTNMKILKTTERHFESECRETVLRENVISKTLPEENITIPRKSASQKRVENNANTEQNIRYKRKIKYTK